MDDEILILDNPGSHQLAAWTLRLVTSFIANVLIVDRHLWALCYAACAGAVEPPASVKGHSKDSISLKHETLLGTIKDLQRQFGSTISGHFASLYLDGLDSHEKSETEPETFKNGLEEWRKKAETLAASAITVSETNVEHLRRILGLTKAEAELLLFQLYRSAPGFAQLYEILLHSERATPIVLGAMLGVGMEQITDALSEEGTLVRSGLVSVQEIPLRLNPISPFLSSTLHQDSEDEKSFIENFVKPLRPKATTASLARLDERDESILLHLLTLPATVEDEINVLVYGSRSVDKRDMLARLFKEKRISAWEVAMRKVPPSDLAPWTYIAQRYLENVSPRSVLVIDHAERVLTARHTSLVSLLGFGSEDEEEVPIDTDEERSSDTGLTTSTVRCVWLTANARSLSERNLGKFLFHCEARPGSRMERRERVAQTVSEFGLSKELEHHLAQYSFLGEHQVRQAAKLSHLLHKYSSPGALTYEHIVRRAVHQSQKALGRDRTEGLMDSVTAYSLEYLNVKGRFTPAQIIKALRRRPKGTLCFHGLPGSGKTQLAEHMAVELDLPLLTRSASDILSKWLGESEQNIARMFAEAEAEGALLFLDEADSFLRDRAMARESWAVTQVNELLQRMERFDGVFIAATNLMSAIDAASLRRFIWKLEFLPLTPEQSWKMFREESGAAAALRASSKEGKELRAQLVRIANLAPGDFATVKRQSLMLGEELSPKEWIEQLSLEAKAKMHGLHRQRLGFEAPDVAEAAAEKRG